MKMSNLNACIVCLSTTARLHHLDVGSLRLKYNKITGLQTLKCEGMTDHICFECNAFVEKYVKFRDKCLRSHFTLRAIQEKGAKNPEAIINYLNLDAMGIKSSLQFMDPNKVHYEIVQFESQIESETDTLNNTNELKIPVTVFSTDNDVLEFNIENSEVLIEIDPDEIHIKTENNDNDILNDYDNDSQEYFDEEFLSDEQDEDEEEDLNKVYATLVPITTNEAKAVHEIIQYHTKGAFKCQTCMKKFKTESLLKHHVRMHDVHFSGQFECDLCYNRYKSDFLLQVHFTGHHKYKYLCTECNEVTFEKTSAKTHYLLIHHKKNNTKNTIDDRPAWLRKRTKRPQQAPSKEPKEKTKKPTDSPIRKTVDQLGQYQMVLDRQLTKNYKESAYKCDKCFKGYREYQAFDSHMKKHDPSISGHHQCDMCKQYFRSALKVYRHIVLSHLYVHECRYCTYRCCSRGQAVSHYKSHKNVKYPCHICDQTFLKPTSRMTHIRTKHPTTAVCNLCGHSFVSDHGLTFHRSMKHTHEEVEQALSLPRGALGIETDIHTGQIKEVGYCDACDMQFVNEDAFLTHLESSSNHVQTNLASKPVRTKQEPRPMRRSDSDKPRRRRVHTEIVNNGLKTSTTCELCGVELKTDMAVKKHYLEKHPGAEFQKKRYMCDVCGHTAQVYSNLQVHMRKHTLEKPYVCPHCNRKFSMPGNRDRHLLVHTGEKKYQCPTCLRRFTQSGALKLHIQTVHMKIPYAPWIKKNRKRKKDSIDSVMTSSVVETASIAVPEPKLHIEATAGECFANYVITYVNQ